MIWALSSYRSYELEQYLLKVNWNYHNLPSKEHGVFMKQPGGQTTKLPLSTDVGPWPGDIFFIFLCLLFQQMYRPGLKVIADSAQTEYCSTFHRWCVRPFVTGVTSHISHTYKGINAMLIIRGPIKPCIF